MADNDNPDYEKIFGDYQQKPKKNRTNGSGSSESTKTNGRDATKSERDSAASFLISLAQSCAEFFHSGEDSFATIDVGQHVETYLIRSRRFRFWLGKQFFQARQRAASSEALASAINTLEGFAQFDSEERQVFVRIAGDAERVWLDLCEPEWRQIEITSTGWRMVASTASPVRFRRANGMLPLPLPERGGSISDLRRFLNVANESDFALALGWLVSAFHPTGPYPLVILHGEQGSAKSTTSRFLRQLIDPNLAALRSEPRESRDLMVAANNGWAIAFDNISHLGPWLSDGLCRLSTGGGFGVRALYTDSDEMLFNARRPVIANGIEEFCQRADLLDRSLLLYLPAIKQRKQERLLNKEFTAAVPRLLGAVCDAVSCAIRNNGSIEIEDDQLPRMADTAMWVTGAEEALGWPNGTFLRALAENVDRTVEIPLEHPVAVRLLELTPPWVGTATELLNRLESGAGEKTLRRRNWPKSPNSLGSLLRRLAPNLRKAGLEVELDRKPDKLGGRRITITARDPSRVKVGNPLSEPSESSEMAPAKDLGSDNSDDSDNENPTFPNTPPPGPGYVQDGEGLGITSLSVMPTSTLWKIGDCTYGGGAAMSGELHDGPLVREALRRFVNGMGGAHEQTTSVRSDQPLRHGADGRPERSQATRLEADSYSLRSATWTRRES